MSELLADGFHGAGHDVHVVTETASVSDVEDCCRSYGITRRPRLAELWRLVAASDVVFHNNVCIRLAWPLVFLRKPWVVATHTWIRRNDGRRSALDEVKVRLLRFATRISASEALGRDLGYPSEIVPNAYDNRTFVHKPEVVRPRGSLVFVGRLVQAKGVHVLLQALQELGQDGTRPTLAVIGDGNQRDELEALTTDLGLAGQVQFKGALLGGTLVDELNSHEIMVIPSLWNEPFGVVALEGVACGLVLLATENGGLPEAVGPCGMTVANGDSSALADGIRQYLTDPNLRQHYLAGGKTHLMRHSPEVMVAGYLRVLEGSRCEARRRLGRKPRKG